MGWFSQSGKSNSETKRKDKKKKNTKNMKDNRDSDHDRSASTSTSTSSSVVNLPVNLSIDDSNDGDSNSISAQAFPFQELAAATKNFQADRLLGEGGFGRVYKGWLESTNEVVAIKQLDRNGLQGNREFLVEVLLSSLLKHPNLVNLIRYCADGDQRLLVYEYMPLGSLEDNLHIWPVYALFHLFHPLHFLIFLTIFPDIPPYKRPLDWKARMKIAAGVAKGLEYLHQRVNPPVIYRDLKCSNILLGEDHHPKLSDFGLAKLGPVGDKSYVSTRVMGTYGYCAPEYASTGQLSIKSDVYSFGVVLLEILTGRKAIDKSKAKGNQSLVDWARPLFKDRKKFSQMADPKLQGQYPTRALYQALAIAAMCVQEDPTMRPRISDVVTALTYLASQAYDQSVQTSQMLPSPTPQTTMENNRQLNSYSSGSHRDLSNKLNLN